MLNEDRVNTNKITTFQDLNSWKEGHKFVIMIYKAVDEFPSRERFGLSNQITRAAISVTSNIAEGFSRNGSREKVQFYYMALGSLTETQNQLLIAKDINYLKTEEFEKINQQSIVVHKLLNGLIKSAKNFENINNRNI